MTDRIRILDCTLRDGGYVNDFQFGKNNILRFISSLAASGVDVIECGFLRDGEDAVDTALYDSVESISSYIMPKNPSVLYVAMIAFGEFDFSKIPVRTANLIDGIRLTFHNSEWEPTCKAALELIAKGYKVFIQPVGTISYSDAELLALIEDVNTIKPYAFYIVDTLGSIQQHNLIGMFTLLERNLRSDIAIGYHAHNNLQLAFSNAIALINIHSSRKLLIDSSAFGMGRGAGNLCTELLMHYLNEFSEQNYSLNPLLEIIDDIILPIYQVYPWGYSVPYFLAAAKSCHPNNASFLLNKQNMTIFSVNEILAKLPQETRHLYKKDIIERLYYDYQINTVDDRKLIARLHEEMAGRAVLVIAPGRTVETERDTIQSYVETLQPVIITVNAIPDFIEEDYVFIGNQKRYLQIREQLSDRNRDSIIISSNIDHDLDDISIADYGKLSSSGEDEDNSGIMAIRLVIAAGVQRIGLAGYDGFSIHSLNYMADEYRNYVDWENLAIRNHNISRQIEEMGKTTNIEFVTTSNYCKGIEK